LAQQGQRGKGVKYNIQLGYFFLFFTFLPSSGEHIFGSIAAFFAPCAQRLLCSMLTYLKKKERVIR